MSEKIARAARAASFIREAVDKALDRFYPSDHPMSDEAIRNTWREHGGSFHGASPDFFGTMPEQKLLDYIRRSVTITSLLISEVSERAADALELSLCENCDGLHIHAMVRGAVKCGMVLSTPEEVDELIDELRKGRREMLKRQAAKATKQ